MRTLPPEYLSQVKAIFAESLLPGVSNEDSSMLLTSVVTKVSFGKVRLVQCCFTGEYSEKIEPGMEPNSSEHISLRVEFEDGDYTHYTGTTAEAKATVEALSNHPNCPEVILANAKRTLRLYEIKDSIPE